MRPMFTEEAWENIRLDSTLDHFGNGIDEVGHYRDVARLSITGIVTLAG